jgi:hypothetical protein
MDEPIPKILEERITKMSDEELAFRGWTREGVRESFRQRLVEDLQSPQIGDIAPDFHVEQLSPVGGRTGTLLTLSSMRGKPVGLIFGSYT